MVRLAVLPLLLALLAGPAIAEPKGKEQSLCERAATLLLSYAGKCEADGAADE